MDCLTYHRIKLAEPQNTAEDVIAHAHSCSDCAAFTRQLETLEQDLHATVNVPVPDGLAEKIILHHGRTERAGIRWFAMAAAIVVTLAALVTFNTLPDQESFAQEFVRHVESEPEIFATNQNVDQSALRQVFAEMGMPLTSQLGEVKYLGQCQIDGVDSSHTLITTSAGDAALLFRPGRRADIKAQKDHQQFAVAVVAAPLGSIAIVAKTQQLASQIRTQILSNTKI